MRKKQIFILTAVIFFSFSFYYITKYHSEKKIKSSPIYKILKEPSSKKFFSVEKISPEENLFIKGIEFYNTGNIDEACKILKKIENQRKDDYVFSVYTDFYLNQCEAVKNGKGNIELIEKILNTMKKNFVLSNDVDLIWYMVSTVVNDVQSRKDMIFLLEKYIKEAKGLKLENRLKIKGYTAIIKMAGEEYGESIYTFYEILSEAEKIKNPDVRSRIQIKSYEYLGNMCFILEDYKTAVKYYDKAISIPMSSLKSNAVSKYGAYVNRSESYIQMKDFEKAKICSLETEKIIPYLPDDLAVGVKIFRYKNLLLLESRRKNFDEARKYYNLCLELLKKDKGNAFINSYMYVELAHSELLIQEEKYFEAEEKLNVILEKNIKEELGFDSAVYIMLLRIYNETEQMEKYFDTGKKLYKTEKNLNETLKKDYLEFIKNSYTFDQLKKQERILKMKFTFLGVFAFFALLSIGIGIFKIKKLNKGNFTDSLTNIYNRKYMDFLAEKSLKEPVYASVVMVDIDCFKNYNDFYGHPAGDKVIKKIAEILKNSINTDDVLIRYGGEEFIIILKNADEKVFKEVYKKILKNLDKENILHEKSFVSDKLTLSIGVAFEYFSKTLDIKEAVKKADKALYISKQNGRNRYTIFNDYI